MCKILGTYDNIKAAWIAALDTIYRECEPDERTYYVEYDLYCIKASGIISMNDQFSDLY